MREIVGKNTSENQLDKRTKLVPTISNKDIDKGKAAGSKVEMKQN